LERLPAKSARQGYLDLEDLCDIARWGGNQHGVIQRLCTRNSQSDVQAKTGEAFRYLGTPERAIGAVLDLKHWGLTYASKTLMFMAPSSYVALDRYRMQPALQGVLPRIWEYRSSMVRGYLDFLEICRTLKVTARPGPNGEWLLADIQSAVFQFASEGGMMVRDEGAIASGFTPIDIKGEPLSTTVLRERR
jgi:hypothetical protein